MKFPYIECPRDPSPAFPHADSFQRPDITINIKNGIDDLDVLALVDSGASHCIFSFNVGLALNINIESGPVQRITGVGGAVISAYFHDVTLQLEDVIWKAYVGFTTNKLGIGGLLGQNGFFSKFKITFDRTSSSLIVNKRTPLNNFLTRIGI